MQSINHDIYVIKPLFSYKNVHYSRFCFGAKDFGTPK